MQYLHHNGHEAFNFKSIEDIQQKLKSFNISLPFNNTYSLLFKKINKGKINIPNAFAVQPMEGCDGTREGAPGRLTYRRYKRFISGGAGLLWFEATAVRNEGRANPHQLMITENNINDFKNLLQKTFEANEKYKPLTVLQLTHSGRYSRPEGKPDPIKIHHNKILDRLQHFEEKSLITDKEIDNLQYDYVKAANLAAESGFDAVDIKACHGYLINSLLAAHTRKNSKYGGSYENRTRFIKEVIDKIKKQNPDLIITTRINVYDGIPYPYGFGMVKDGSMKPDLSEPIRLINQLAEKGLEIANIAMGNPYYNPHIERPFDKNIKNGYIPESHPLENIAENMKMTRKINKNIKDKIITVASGLSWLRQFIPDIASGLISEDWVDIIGLGRAFFAYPGLVNDLKNTGKLKNDKLCICCSSCSQMMRDGVESGCLIRDSKVYQPIYNKGRKIQEDD